MATAYPFVIPRKMFTEQRQRLGKALTAAFANKKHAALLQGGSEVPINSTDCNYLFVQESYFNYLFGYQNPEACGAVLHDGTGILFLPRLPAEYAVWMGELETPESAKQSTGIEEVYYVDQVEEVLAKKGVETVEVLEGANSDSGLSVLTAQLKGSTSIQTSKSWLFSVLSTQRCYKTALEAEVLKYVCGASSRAHIEVMQHCKSGMSQHQLESTFLHHAYYHGGCRKVSYTCICATGHHNATLHYPNNDAPIVDGSIALLDMGGQYQGYASDITCSFPVNGKFTEEQKMVYNAVLDAHDTVMRTMKPGVSWVDMHHLALRVMCGHMVKAGMLVGDVDTLMEKEIMALFQPHGLGHLIGLDVHDVGGYLEDTPARPTRKDACKLRTARVLQKDFYMTVEPGMYINRPLLSAGFEDPKLKEHLNKEKLMSMWDFGGVRIESDVLVTDDGIINFTVVPRTVGEIEETMAGKPFSKEIEVYKN